MRKRFVIGNWKMNGSKASVQALLTALRTGVTSPPAASVEVVVCPPYVFLEQAQALLAQSSIAWGAQNVACEQKGAYTGEISATMLVEFSCQFVLIGHSERRSLFRETDEQLARKFAMATSSGITPIFCIGETLEEYQTGRTQLVLQRQLAGIMNLGEASFGQTLLAYEPIWAIGTGVSASPVQVQTVHDFLRKEIACRYPNLVQRLPILYGGSVHSGNAAGLSQMPDIDGVLVGSASLCADEFLGIYKIFSSPCPG